MFESTADNKSLVRPSLRCEFITFSRRAAFTVYIWVEIILLLQRILHVMVIMVVINGNTFHDRTPLMFQGVFP